MTTLQITNLSHDGRGVGRDESGKTVFIDGVLPGEIVTYTLTSKKRRYNDAQVAEIISPAAEREVPKCAHFLSCGGCSQQHIQHAVQIKAKQQSLVEQLKHFGKVEPQRLLPPLLGPIWGYRNKARLGVKFVIKKGKVLVGFREKHKSYLADIASCEVLHPVIGSLITQLKVMIQSLAAYQHIAQLEVAVGDDKLAVIFRNLQALNTADQQILQQFAQQHNFDLYLQPQGVDSISKLWPEDNVQRLYYKLPDFNLQFAFHPTDFTQINPMLNQAMVRQALELMQLNTDDSVLDLFCGLGNFTLPIATKVAAVTGVEGSTTMVERAYENAKLNNITNVSFYAADLSKDQASELWAQNSYNKILIDPPRSGAAEVLPLVASFRPEMILYVSCNPATLARDSGILCHEYGYKLAASGIMDMFPHTMHVEAMALFIKG